MIQAKDYIQPAFERGYRFWTGVPCSFLTPFINACIQDPRLHYVGAASEGEAVAIAFGSHLAGEKPTVICQNSGLGNTINPLASLNDPFRVPALLIVTSTIRKHRLLAHMENTSWTGCTSTLL